MVCTCTCTLVLLSTCTVCGVPGSVLCLYICLCANEVSVCMCVCCSVQDYFTHYPGHGLLATTHIILKTAQGDKYDRAIQWGVPALSDRCRFTIFQSCMLSSTVRSLRTPVYLPEILCLVF